MEPEDRLHTAVAMLIGRVAAADVKIARLRQVLERKGLVSEEELEMEPAAVEEFIRREYDELLALFDLVR